MSHTYHGKIGGWTTSPTRGSREVCSELGTGRARSWRLREMAHGHGHGQVSLKPAPPKKSNTTLAAASHGIWGKDRGLAPKQSHTSNRAGHGQRAINYGRRRHNIHGHGDGYG